MVYEKETLGVEEISSPCGEGGKDIVIPSAAITASLVCVISPRNKEDNSKRNYLLRNKDILMLVH